MAARIRIDAKNKYEAQFAFQEKKSFEDMIKQKNILALPPSLRAKRMRERNQLFSQKEVLSKKEG